MRKSDLSQKRQATAESLPGHSGVWTVTPDEVPHTIPHQGNEAALALASEALDRLNTHLAQLPHRSQILSALDRLEAVASSQMEGTETAVDELFYLEATDDADSLPKDASVTFQYVRATSDAFEEVARLGVTAFNDEFIIGIHSKLMEGTPHSRGGYRSVQNRIGGLSFQEARFVPPRPHHVPRLMTNLLELLRYEPDGVMHTSIIMRMAIVHAQFEMIHPFTDGNGRVGRILMRLMLEAEGYFPVHMAHVLKNAATEYNDHLLAMQMRDEWSGWLGFISRAVYIACRQIEFLASELSAMPERWSSAYKLRKNSSAEKLLPLLISHPVITVNQASNLLGVTFKAANDGIAKLVALGILQEPKNQRYRTFRANEVLWWLSRDLNEMVTLRRDKA